ncbi:right-handed parallel beta-helix repeat-containing protein [Picrophilus oshimae]|uniref:Hypothetical extracellular protein n=1 Tax=Picrophilus torridus (strain ATCC 700027 / DSM 9790 / JCM 10055 / NBRC 100828 / KAW 2/3) TaxID=1122961 RepID=Q6L2W4_PICTO|nr:right-handed parallel beta-helix repeat-containing protein [Picrophilus oshimae]AAT42687.1 hypothetical extracellular protein [Picrophilus oshimae DSM 9789]
MTNKLKALIVLLVVVVAIIGFTGGYYYGISSHSKGSKAIPERSGNIGIGNMTAKIIAQSNETISGDINATGYSFGVYIGPGVTNVTVENAYVHGADNSGIIAIDTNHISIVSNRLHDNGLKPDKSIPISGTIGLYGVSDSYIMNNNVTGNNVSGIVVSTSSSEVPAGIPVPMKNVSVHNVIVLGNIVAEDAGGCGIVIVAWGPFMMISNVTVEKNLVTGSLLTPHGPAGPYVGTIVIAADFPFSQADNNSVIDNRVIGGLEDGIIINNQAAAAKDLYNKIIGNYIQEGSLQRINNPPFDNASDTNLANEMNAIAVYSNYMPSTAKPVPPNVNYTVIADNTIVEEQIGIWLANSYNNYMSNNTFINVETDVSSHYGIS